MGNVSYSYLHFANSEEFGKQFCLLIDHLYFVILNQSESDSLYGGDWNRKIPKFLGLFLLVVGPWSPRDVWPFF